VVSGTNFSSGWFANQILLCNRVCRGVENEYASLDTAYAGLRNAIQVGTKNRKD
jgi:hypothetical protein